ncbi:hypothetical protein Tcan_04320 [Toxocara canis]|uniref:Uncharacterized protein n=1 Tax=Toxocara canis TaxID=6265 RepID=A0A0B2VNS7_TOXCA|nr:hypothetical protein Tcan_04320 [Toxocara canis]
MALVLLQGPTLLIAEQIFLFDMYAKQWDTEVLKRRSADLDTAPDAALGPPGLPRPASSLQHISV